MFDKIFGTIKLVLITFLLVCGVVFAFKGYAWINTKLDHMEEQHQAELEAARQYKEYADNVVRAQTEIVESLKDEIEALKKENKRAINDMLAEIKEKNEQITNMGETIGKLNENIRDLRVASDHEYKRGTGDYNEQYFKKVMYRAKDEEGNVIEVPIAWAMFFPNREPDKQWKTGVYPLEYHSRIIQSEQEDGQWNTYTEIWFENNKDSASRGLEVPVKIVSSEFKQVKNEDKEFYWWAPHINLNVSFGVSSEFDVDETLLAGISVSTSGYGRTKNDLDWKFFEVGVLTNTEFDEAYFTLMPFSYNLGNHIPLVSNTFIGPFGGVSTEGDFVSGVGITIPF